MMKYKKHCAAHKVVCVYSRTSCPLSSPPTGSQSFHNIFCLFAISCFVWYNKRIYSKILHHNIAIFTFQCLSEYFGFSNLCAAQSFLKVYFYMWDVGKVDELDLRLEIWSNLTWDFNDTLKFKMCWFIRLAEVKVSIFSYLIISNGIIFVIGPGRKDYKMFITVALPKEISTGIIVVVWSKGIFTLKK